MKTYCYAVKFELGGRSEIVHACNKGEARILAQAKQIKKGNRYDDIESINKAD